MFLFVISFFICQIMLSFKIEFLQGFWMNLETWRDLIHEAEVEHMHGISCNVQSFLFEVKTRRPATSVSGALQ